MRLTLLPVAGCCDAGRSARGERFHPDPAGLLKLVLALLSTWRAIRDYNILARSERRFASELGQWAGRGSDPSLGEADDRWSTGLTSPAGLARDPLTEVAPSHQRVVF